MPANICCTCPSNVQLNTRKYSATPVVMHILLSATVTRIIVCWNFIVQVAPQKKKGGNKTILISFVVNLKKKTVFVSIPFGYQANFVVATVSNQNTASFSNKTTTQLVARETTNKFIFCFAKRMFWDDSSRLFPHNRCLTASRICRIRIPNRNPYSVPILPA